MSLGNMNDQQTILHHYNLTTPYPTSWPAEKDECDSPEEELSHTTAKKIHLRRSNTRYSALELHAGGRRSLVPGAEKTGDGLENLVHIDEADPLGGSDNVVRVLRQKGIAVEDDQRLSEAICGACISCVDVS